MKRYLHLAVSLILAALLAATSLIWMSQTASISLAAPLATWYVNPDTGDNMNDCQSPGTACETIAEAAARASDSDSIQLAAGVYSEALEISKQLTLIGAGTSATFLNGEDTHRVLRTSSQNGLTLTELTIQNGRTTGENGAGIFNSQSLTLTNVALLTTTPTVAGRLFTTPARCFLKTLRYLATPARG